MTTEQIPCDSQPHSHLRSDAIEQIAQQWARVLHDGVMQHLANAIIQLECCQKMARQGSPALLTELAQVKAQVQRALEALRDCARDMRLSSANDRPLVEALHDQVQDFAVRTGIPVSLSLSALSETFSPREKSVILGVIGEALQNVYKHAHASQVAIWTARDGQALTVTIADNGHGFEMVAVSLGLGLLDMRDRARSIGGNLTITSLPGHGTRVMLRFAPSQMH